MRRRARASVVLAALLVGGVGGVGGCVVSKAGISPYGKTATLYPRNGSSVSGELIASNSDSIWLLRNGAVTSYSSANVRAVDVERHGLDGRKTLVWMTLAGAATGSALTIACNQYNSDPQESNADCSGVLPGTLLFFAALGGIFAVSNDYSSMYHLVPQDTNRLRAFSRFPQGVPDSLRTLRLLTLPAGALRRD